MGLTLPVADGTPGPAVVPGFGVLSGKPIADESGRALGAAQYAVPAATAVLLLERTNPQAAGWWRENVPRAVQPGQVFGFAADVCEPLAPADERSQVEGATPPLLEVTYTSKLSDLVECSMQYLKRSPVARRQFAVAMTIIPVAWIALAGLVFACVHWVVACSVVAIGVLHTTLYPVIHRRDAERRIRQHLKSMGTRGVTGPITLTLTADRLTYRTETTTTTVRWRDMEGVRDLGDSTYIVVSGMQAAIIPRRGFERGDEYDAVRDLALAVLPRLP